jgi:hypothetical protein
MEPQRSCLLQLRIAPETRDELARRAARLRAEHPGIAVSVSAIARDVLLAGLERPPPKESEDEPRTAA